MKGLVIDEPWISKILAGTKTWEMRSRATQIRGRIALIRKGSGTVVGLATLTDCIGPLDAIARRAHRDKHAIPSELDDSTEKWNIAWELRDAVPLVAPVRYAHPSGAVIWVALDDEVSNQLVGDYGRPAIRRQTSFHQSPKPYSALTARQGAAGLAIDFSVLAGIPVARDGSRFSPALMRAGKYTIGRKGEEQQISDFAAALEALRKMPTPYWRRPNASGNWGIVAGIRWTAQGETF